MVLHFTILQQRLSFVFLITFSWQRSLDLCLCLDRGQYFWCTGLDLQLADLFLSVEQSIPATPF